MKKLTLLVLISILMVACGGKAVKPEAPKDVRPISHEVREVESTNSAETLLRATGQGSSVEYAITDAKKAAIWFLLYAGTKPFLKTADEKHNFTPVEEKLYSDFARFIRYTSGLKSKKKLGNTTYVDIIVKVDVTMLKQYLVDNGVIKSSEDVAESIGLPAISIVASDASKI